MTRAKENPDPTHRQNRWRWLVTFLLCLVIIVVGLGIADYVKKTSPKAQKRAPVKNIPRVASMKLFPDTHKILVSAMGSVVPSREITLKSRVSGQIQSIHSEFMTGGFIAKGQRLLKIDPQDYQLALARKESQVVNAQYELKVEMGFQEVAQREWSLLNKRKPAPAKDVELALRKPHLAKVRSDLAAAQAELEQAKLNLSRTDITVPFNALVRAKHVEVGSQVSTQDALADLVGTDGYWIRVSLPVDQLRWIKIPGTRSETGARATVSYRGHHRSGRVIRLLGDLETQGRMARILVSVRDPLGLKNPAPDAPPILIGEYVRIEIQGAVLSNVYRIPRSALRDNNTIWLIDKNSALQVKPVNIVWRDDRIVLIKDPLLAGDHLIISDLATPVEGMQVETSTDGPSTDGAASKKEDETNG